LDRLAYGRWDAAAQAHAACGENGYDEEAATPIPVPARSTTQSRCAKC
jgi:hypothetical protein